MIINVIARKLSNSDNSYREKPAGGSVTLK